MPYPHSNSLGKNPPPGSKAASKLNQVAFKGVEYSKGKVVSDFTKLVDNELYKISDELKAEQQKKMMDQLFGAKPTTIKFPNVQPVQFKGDFPGNAGANKYGKPDLSAIPPEGPAKLWTPPSPPVNLIELQQMMNQGLITKEKLYAQLYGASEEKVATTAVMPPKPQSFMGFTKPATTLGDENSFEIHMKFSIEGLEGLDDKVLNAKQLVAKQFIYGSYGKPATEKIVDDMLRQIKLEIMEQMKKGK